MRVGIVTVSDRSSQGLREDLSGKLLAELVRKIPAEIVARQVVPDEKNRIQAVLISWVDDLDCEVVLTTGGTGIASRDVTPEATSEILEKEIPGVSEALRQVGQQQTPRAVLSRGVAGVRKRSLIVNLPGSPEAVREAFKILGPLLAHAVGLIRGTVMDCRTDERKGRRKNGT